MSENFFITGTTGFIGFELIKRLVQEGHQVHALYRSEEKIKTLPDFPGKAQVHFYKGTLDDPEVLKKAMEGCHGVFHIAALARAWSESTNDFYKINVEGTRNILEAAKLAGVNRVVFTSTGGTLASGDIQDPSNEDTPRKKGFFNLYEKTKYEAEELVSAYNGGDLETVIVNPTRVYGPGHLTISNAATKLIEFYIKGKWRLMLGKGHSVGNFTYVKDVVEGHIKAMHYGKAGEQYILGGENLSLMGYFQKIAEQSGKNYKMYKIPMTLALLFGKLQKLKADVLKKPPLITPEWVRKYYYNWAYSSEKAKKAIGYEITPADQAIKETIDWINQKGD